MKNKQKGSKIVWQRFAYEKSKVKMNHLICFRDLSVVFKHCCNTTGLVHCSYHAWDMNRWSSLTSPLWLCTDYFQSCASCASNVLLKTLVLSISWSYHLFVSSYWFNAALGKNVLKTFPLASRELMFCLFNFYFLWSLKDDENITALHFLSSLVPCLLRFV